MIAFYRDVIVRHIPPSPLCDPPHNPQRSAETVNYLSAQSPAFVLLYVCIYLQNVNIALPGEGEEGNKRMLIPNAGHHGRHYLHFTESG